jgi:hypothetical protein
MNMKLTEIETSDIIRELLKRVGPDAYRSHKHQLEQLAFKIGVEQQEADLRHANR